MYYTWDEALRELRRELIVEVYEGGWRLYIPPARPREIEEHPFVRERGGFRDLVTGRRYETV